MKTAVLALTGLLLYGVLSLWIEPRWAWSLCQVGIFFLAGCLAVRSHRFHPDAAMLVLAAAAAWPFLQIAAGSSVSACETWSAALNWFTFLVVFLLARHVLTEPGARGWFLRVVPIAGALLAAVATAQNYSSSGKIFWMFPSGFSDDVFGPFVNRNQFAAWIELLLPIALYRAAADRRLRALYGCSAAVMLGSVIASASRAGSVLACAEVVAVMALLAVRRAVPRRALLAGAVQFIVLASIAGAVMGWQGLRHRFDTPGTEALRVDAVRASLQMVRERPLMGGGLGTWSTLYPRYAGFDAGVFVNQAHNDWVQWAAEGGVPFFLFLAVFAALLCKPAVQSIYGLGTVAFLLHALVDYPMQQRPALAAWFFAVAGAAMAWRDAQNAGIARSL
jgi:hypothetical protein